jgi:hypothetical protein
MRLDAEDRQWILDTLEENPNRVYDRLGEMENRLTTVINRRFGSLDMRQRGTSADIAALRMEMDDLKDRMGRLEGTSLAPPEV